MQDLSIKHGPIGSLFGADRHRDDVISSAHCEFFNDNGYVAGIGLLNAEQTAALRSHLAVMMSTEYSDDARFYEYHRDESQDESRTLFHALGAWRVSAAFHDLVFYPPLAFAAARLLGGAVRLWHDQLFVKPASDGGVVAWHQDYSYWTRTKPIAHLTCWVALDDSTIENGCIHYVPGSHQWPLLPRGKLADDMNSVFCLLNDEQKARFKPVPIELKVGEASFHHPMLMHGSDENRSNRPRRAAVLNFMLDGVVSTPTNRCSPASRRLQKGKRSTGDFFH